MTRTATLYIAASQDGYIAGEGDSLAFLENVQAEGEDYGYGEFIATVDTVVVGRKTYEKVLSMGFPYHEDKQVYVCTRTERVSDRPGLRFHTGDPVELMDRLKTEPGGGIYCDGGAELARYLLAAGRIDVLVLSVVPVRLGGGTELFAEGRVPDAFDLRGSVQFDSGLVQHTYVRRRSR